MVNKDNIELVKTEDEFYKLVFITIRNIIETRSNDEIDDAEFGDMLISGVQVLCHEYHRLVNEGVVDGYELEFEGGDKDRVIKAVKESLLDANVALCQAGVPFIEEDDGKLSIDYKKLNEEVERERGEQ